MLWRGFGEDTHMEFVIEGKTCPSAETPPILPLQPVEVSLLIDWLCEIIEKPYRKYQFYANQGDQKPDGAEDEFEITLEQVKNAYRKFVPLATIQFLMFLPEDVNRVDANLLEKARSIIDDTMQFVKSDNMEISGEPEEDRH